MTKVSIALLKLHDTALQQRQCSYKFKLNNINITHAKMK